MGDSYRPGGDGHGRHHSSSYDRSQNRNYRPQQQYDHYSSRSGRHHDSYPPRGSNNHSSGPPPRDGGFTFRGAAGGQSYRPEQDFTFSAPGPRAPNGFAPEPAGGSRDRPRRLGRDGRPPRVGDRSRGGNAHSRGRGGAHKFGPRPAHDRAILNRLAGARDTTPEQLEGMDEGPSRFKNVSDTSDDDGSEDDAPRKRAKVEPPEAPARPQWSNPDPYTVLPPPETLGAPKKDIVQVIRKAKNEQASKSEGADNVAGNADFISFNFGDDDNSNKVDEVDNDGDTAMDAPPAKSPARGGEPSFSHRDEFHRKTSSSALPANDVSTPSWTPINPRKQVQPPLPGSTEYGGPPPRPLGDMELANPPSPIVPEPVSRPPKRKSRHTRELGEVTEEWEVVNGQPPAPWCKTDGSDCADVGLRLQKEICDFFEFVKPRPFEAAARIDLINRVQVVIRSYNGIGGATRDAEVDCFGSFASGLYLPTGDMDLVVRSQSFVKSHRPSIGQSNNQLRNMTEHIERSGLAKPHTATFIGRSKVPIVKFTDKLTGIKVDISFENNSGFPAIKTFEAWKEKYPGLPVLVAVIKQLLVMRGINEVFSGGIGGFTTICLVTHILQTMPEIQSGAMDPTQHYGEILMKFLDFYGNKLDIRSCGILMHPPYSYDKEKHPRISQNDERLTIIDPTNPDNDISGGSHKIDVVLDRFRNAYNEMQRYMARIHSGKIRTKSILECIIGGNYGPVEDQRRRLKTLFGTADEMGASELAPAPIVPPGGKKKAKQATKAKGQSAMPAQPNPANPAPAYVDPMANVPSGGEYGYAKGISPHPLVNYNCNHCFTGTYPQYQYTVGSWPAYYTGTRAIPPPPPFSPSPPPPPPPSPPPPPPPEGTAAPSSPASSASMDLSD